MSAAKHTPGLLSVEEYEDVDGDDQLLIVADGEKGPACWRVLAKVVHSLDCDDETTPVTKTEMEANAKLYAAAPELLAACEAQEALAEHDARCHDCGAAGDCAEGDRLYDKTRELRRAAIARAKGGAT